MYGFESQADLDKKRKALNEVFASVNANNARPQASSIQTQQAQSTSSPDLNGLKDLWNTSFDQRQREADKNAERAYRFRDLESVRNFGQEKDLSKQGFEQDRAIRNDELTSISNREAAQAQARERLAGVQQQLQQRQQESERGAAMSAFRGRR